MCEDKNEAMVRYTLPENENRIFASSYELYLLTGAEIQAQQEQLKLLTKQ